MKQNAFPELVQRFFTSYLAVQRNLSAHTQIGYRNTFRLLLQFLGKQHRRPVDQLSLGALTPEAILAFLDHLERSRGNSIRTRNLRLAAIRTFVRFVLGQSMVLDFLATGQRILAIPQKKSTQPLLGYMNRDEVAAVFAAIDRGTRSGQRDLLLFLLLYNTGARISEALQMRAKDFRDRSVHLHGKGRKDRQVPIWPQTVRRLRQWCQLNRIGQEQLIFTNRLGAPLSHDAVALRLDLAVHKATVKCPSLRGRRITSHTWRHSCAMALLQSGVALEVIALYLGHSKPITTHGYIEADLKMKADCMRRLTEPPTPAPSEREEPSRLLAFLRAL
jgi:integrase/recombinase XerD